MSLTAPERETVITFSDESGTATIHTHQHRIITELRNNPAATEIEDLTFDGTAGAVFELPADLISYRSTRRTLSPRQRQPISIGRGGEPPRLRGQRRFSSKIADSVLNASVLLRPRLQDG
jgi:hypothetical protein